MIYLKRQKTKMRVKQVELPLSNNPALGRGIDVTTLPEGHLTCNKCNSLLFECWVSMKNHSVEMGCMKCGHSYKLLFPLDVSLTSFGKDGRFTCQRKRDAHHNKVDHSNLGFIVIHNIDIISFGCEKCTTEVLINTKTKSDLVIV